MERYKKLLQKYEVTCAQVSDILYAYADYVEKTEPYATKDIEELRGAAFSFDLIEE